MQAIKSGIEVLRQGASSKTKNGLEGLSFSFKSENFS